MTAATVGVAQGAASRKFNVIDHRGIGADPFNVCATTTPDFGALVYFTGENEVSLADGTIGASAILAGFCDPKVVDDMTDLRIDVHGEKALVDVDKVGIWRVGRYRLALVSGSVSAGDIVYPAAGGTVGPTQTSSCPAVGICRVGNSVAGGEIEVEIDLQAHGA
jgi:hypothetical protein